MKRILVALLFVLACEHPREASEMPHTITPDPTHNPQTYTDAPSDGDDATAASVDGFFQDIADKAAYLEAGGVANNAVLAALTGQPDHAHVWSNGVHTPFTRESATAVAADGNWVVTSADGGRFLHPNYSDVTGQRLPSIGPVPSETTTHPTSAGRINKQFVPMGVFSYALNTLQGQYNTTSGSNVTLASPIDTDGFSAAMRPLAQFDVIEFTASAWINGNSGAAFNVIVWLETSPDAGVTWTPVTANGGALQIALTADNLPKALPLSFFSLYPAISGGVTGRFMIRLRAISDGTHQLIVTVDSDIFRVIRP